MRVKRVTANIETSDIRKADAFYHDVLGLECVMDLGWTYGSDSKMTVQVSVALEGGSGTPFPDLSTPISYFT